MAARFFVMCFNKVNKWFTWIGKAKNQAAAAHEKIRGQPPFVLSK